MSNERKAGAGLAAATGLALVKRVSKMNGEEIAAAIEASHPMETEEAGVMDADALAMHLVGARHEKRGLVNLVRWLLIGAPNNQALPRRPAAPHRAQSEHDKFT